MIHRDDLPVTPDWSPDPRCCPFEKCATCGPDVEPELTISPLIELGEN